MFQRSLSIFPALWLVACIFMSSMHLAFSNSRPPFEVQCDFGIKSNSSSNFSATITGTLAARFGNARQCHITHRVSSAIVRIFLSTINITSNSSMLYTVVMKKAEILFLGAADFSYLANGQRYHFHTCPQELAKEETELKILVLGVPENATFKIQVDLDKSSLRASDTSSGIAHVREDGLSEVLLFDVEKGHLFELHQITARSQDSEMECILIISQNCQAVQRQGLVGAISGNDSIRLSFTKFGRITLSQYSYPRIAAGRWFIGVYAKEKRPEHTQEKEVEITVNTSYKYDSMAVKSLPTIYMFLVTLLGGVAIAVFAHFFLNSDFEKTELLYTAHPDKEDGNLRELQSKVPKRFVRHGKSITDYIPEPLSKRTFPIKTWVSVICKWFSEGMKTYSYITGVLAISFMVGSSQFVIALWSSMIKSGNRDMCYYNEGCYRPIAISDMPSNFMLSNVPYIILGILLSLAFSFREAISRESKNKYHAYDVSLVNKHVPYDYSLSYAFSWALVFEGLFSATYHLCPSRLTFQFDSAFMFIISGLVVVALFNSRINRFLFSTQEKKNNKKSPSETVVQAPKYFLFYVAPLLILNYVGSVKDTEGLPHSMEVMYWIALIVWLVALYCWMFKKVAVPWKWSECRTAEGAVKWFWVIVFPICLLLIGMIKVGDWSQFFLFSCVAAVALSIVGMITLNLALSCKRWRFEGTGYRDVLKVYCHPREVGKSLIKHWHRILFCIICFLFWVFAMYFFKIKPTTRKVASPSFSRTLNHECVLWDFFDYHDIWHMLSSFALFMSAYLLVYITRKSEKIYYVESQYNNSKNPSTSGEAELNIQGKNRDLSTEGGTGGGTEKLGEQKQMVTYV